MRAIVTGGAGFIGSHLVDALLARGDEVHVVDDLSSGRRDQVPEAAGFSQLDIRDSLEPVFNEVRHGAQVVFSSTGGAIYGECDTPAPENASLEPISPYGVSKLAAEEYLSAYARLYDESHVSLRYANVYGPRQDSHGEAGVVAIFFGAFARREAPVIFGDGEQTRDFVYVGDVVDATLAAQGRSGVYNVGTGVETSVRELYEVCARVARVEVEAGSRPERAGEILRSVVDPSRAARDLGWKAETRLEAGLAETWRFMSGQEGA